MHGCDVPPSTWAEVVIALSGWCSFDLQVARLYNITQFGDQVYEWLWPPVGRVLQNIVHAFTVVVGPVDERCGSSEHCSCFHSCCWSS